MEKKMTKVLCNYPQQRIPTYQSSIIESEIIQAAEMSKN